MALSPAEKQARYRERQRGLEAARARGRAYGTHEADRQGLVEFDEVFILDGRKVQVTNSRSERIARAERYAEWLFEGRPVKGQDWPPYKPGIVP